MRGDVIDIFPAESEREALRVELFDDEIESLTLFDPLTGEILRKVPRYTIYPKTHYVTPRERLVTRGRSDSRRAARAAERAVRTQTSWSKRSGWSSARASTSR